MPLALRPALAAALALATAYSLLAAAPAATSHAGRTHALEPTATPLPPCAVTATRTVAPLTARVGERVDVTVSLAVGCPIERFPLHIIYVIDDSSDMDSREGRDVRHEVQQAMLDFIPNERTDLRVGVVGYNTRPTVRCALTRDTRAAARCFNRLAARGQAHPDAGITAALALLTRARHLATPGDVIREVVILVAHQPQRTSQCSRARSAMSRLKDQGVLVISVCGGTDCDAACIRDLATSPRYFLPWRSSVDVGRFLRSLFTVSRVSWTSIILKRLALTETLPSAVTLIPDSGQPEPVAIGQAPTTITWRITHVPKDGLTMTYGVRLDAIGTLTVPEGSNGSFLDNKNRFGTFDVPGGHVDVLP